MTHRWLLSTAAMLCGAVIASIGMLGVIDPKFLRILMQESVPERVGYLFLAMGFILYLNFVTTTDDR